MHVADVHGLIALIVVVCILHCIGTASAYCCVFILCFACFAALHMEYLRGTDAEVCMSYVCRACLGSITLSSLGTLGSKTAGPPAKSHTPMIIQCSFGTFDTDAMLRKEH